MKIELSDTPYPKDYDLSSVSFEGTFDCSFRWSIWQEIFLKGFGDQNLVFPNKPLDFLEIGVHQAQTTLFFNHILPQNSTTTCIDTWEGKWDCKDKALSNLKLLKKDDLIHVYQGDSFDIMNKLYVEGKRYDLIYIDGNHTASAVLGDAVMGWKLLRPNGVIFFDDYVHSFGEGKIHPSPKIAIDAILNCFNEEFTMANCQVGQIFIKKNNISIQ